MQSPISILPQEMMIGRMMIAVRWNLSLLFYVKPLPASLVSYVTLWIEPSKLSMLPDHQDSIFSKLTKTCSKPSRMGDHRVPK